MSKLKIQMILSDDETNPTKLMMMLGDMMRYVKGEVRVESLSVSSSIRIIPSVDFAVALAFIKQGQVRGCSDKELADKLSISPEHLSRIKNNHSPLTDEVATKVIEVMYEMGVNVPSTSDTAVESE